MNGKMVGSKPLYVALAQRKEERRARLQVSFWMRNANQLFYLRDLQKLEGSL